MPLELPNLPYAYDALDPYMSAETFEYHHDKHHKAYVDNGNKLLEGSGLEDKSLEEIIKASHGSNPGIFNNVAQHYNHILFWNCMQNNPDGTIPGNLESKIIEDFGSVDQFKEDFTQAGLTQFGSGWAWLSLKNGKLQVTKTPNGENPVLEDAIPLLGCDVWEHSYYIDYRNARPAYMKAFVDNMINWEYVAELFEKAS